MLKGSKEADRDGERNSGACAAGACVRSRARVALHERYVLLRDFKSVHNYENVIANPVGMRAGKCRPTRFL